MSVSEVILNNSYFTKGREITDRQLDCITSENEAHCLVPKCCSGSCSAAFIPRKQTVKPVEALPKGGSQPAFCIIKQDLYLTFYLYQ